MAIIPENKQWKQRNDGDSFGNLYATWGADLETNKGSARVPTGLKNVFDSTDDADLTDSVAKYVEYSNQLWAVSDELFNTATDDVTADITLTANWSQDVTASSPDPSASVTDAVVFDSLLLVVDGNDIVAYNGSTWSSWWQGTLGQSALSTGQTFILKVGPDGNLYITDSGKKIYRVTPAGVVSKTGVGTLDFSDRPFILRCATTTSTRIFYGTEDNEGENAVIIEWDMGTRSISANKLHPTGAKRVLCMGTWEDTPIAILSDGSIKYFNGSAFVNWDGARLPETKYAYADDAIHKNGFAVIDNLPHFLINPRLESSSDGVGYSTNTENNWFYPAGVYCLDPDIGLYCRYPLSDGVDQHFMVQEVGALFARSHRKTKFFASYTVYPTPTTSTSIIAAEDRENTLATTSWMIPTPFESLDEVMSKLKLIHRKLESGESIDLYYRFNDEPTIILDGNWLDTKNFNTTTTVTDIEKGWVAFMKTGKYFLSTVSEITTGTTNQITFKDANSNITVGQASTFEFINFKHMGSLTNHQTEIDDLTIPDAKKSRQVWIWIVLNKVAGSTLELDYLVT